MAKRGTMSRRRVIGIGASTAVALAVANNSVAIAGAPGPGTPRPRAGEPAFAEPAVVGGLVNGVVDATTIGSGQHLQAPPVGFPATVQPRTDDLVTMSDRTPTRTMGAFPLCRWVTGVPRIDRAGSFVLGTVAVLPTPELVEAAERKTAVRVCILDTNRKDHLVLAVRQPN